LYELVEQTNITSKTIGLLSVMQMEPYLGLKWINSKIFRKMIELEVLGSIRIIILKLEQAPKIFLK
jgi:hypothetical protein